MSENVKRGIRQKLRRVEWPELAPFGYVNNPKTRNIELAPVKSKIIKRAFEEYSHGKHTLESLGEQLKFWGVISKNGKPLCKATIQRMLTNKVYIGLIVHNSETYEDKFKLIFSRATFEIVQEVLKNRTKPRHSKKRHYFPFTELFKCGECSAAITAKWAHGNDGTYRYYHCTKQVGPCSQRYLREDLLVEKL
ncbi:MAG: recombinase family protein [candidate division WOR-3 bacterium]